MVRTNYLAEAVQFALVLKENLLIGCRSVLRNTLVKPSVNCLLLEALQLDCWSMD